ncbi:MAG: hypothetical protein CSYNP_03539 [Syntrophus sp. SKADARSKE-3]|nr:hypothetical protein [Syntrophus sp. SKADARSKE-3]
MGEVVISTSEYIVYPLYKEKSLMTIMWIYKFFSRGLF